MNIVLYFVLLLYYGVLYLVRYKYGTHGGTMIMWFNSVEK